MTEYGHSLWRAAWATMLGLTLCGFAIDPSAGQSNAGDPYGDFEGDGDVDLYDFTAFQICMSIAEPALATGAPCTVFDVDSDGTLDLLDAAAFGNVYSGPLSGVLVEAGGLVPIAARPGDYSSGEPGKSDNNALHGHAAQATLTQDDLWYAWSLVSKPPGSGLVILSNTSRPRTAYTLLRPVIQGVYTFRLTVTNLLTHETGEDTVSLNVLGCAQAADCDDGAFCNGAELCNAGACTSGAPPCAANDVCDEAKDECRTVCKLAVDCDDGNGCTVDACVNEDCMNFPIDCDDQVACTDDDCFEGQCSHTDNCSKGQTCNTNTGLCEAASGCTSDAACQDGLFCNGLELCDVGSGTCFAGSRPCDDNEGAGCSDPDGIATEECTETECSALCTPCGQCFLFTLSQDQLSGTPGDNCFSAPLIFNAPTGTQVASLQTGDAAHGLAGRDTLEATLVGFGLSVVPASLTSMEDIRLTYYGNAPNDGSVLSLSAVNVSGVERITSVGSIDDIVVTGLQELSNFGFQNINDSNVDLQLDFAQASVTAGLSDEITLNVAARAGTATITTPAIAGQNGFETIRIESTGNAPNALTAVVHPASSLAAARFLGDQSLSLNLLPNSVRTIDAATLGGGLQLGSGLAAGGYTSFNLASLLSVQAGAGADVIILGNTLDSNDFASGTCDLGANTDVVQATFSSDLFTSSPLRNVEEFRVHATALSTVNMAGATGLTLMTMDADGMSNNLTLLNVPAFGGQFPILNYRGNNNQAAQTYDAVTYVAVGNGGSADALSVRVNNRGTALNSVGIVNTHNIPNLTAGGFETLSITCSDGPCSFQGLNASTLVTLIVTASSNLTLGTVDASAATILAVNAQAVMGNFTATVEDVATGCNFTMGSGNDSLTVGPSSTATSTFVTLGGGHDTFVGDTNTSCADTITAGEGNDLVIGALGSDTMTLGSGIDTVVFDAQVASHSKIVTDFAAAAGGDILRFDISSLALGNNGAEASGSFASLANAHDVFLLTGASFATDAAAESAITADNDAAGPLVLIYFNATDRTTHLLYDFAAETDATPVALIGRLTNISSQAAHDQLSTTANIEAQP